MLQDIIALFGRYGDVYEFVWNKALTMAEIELQVWKLF